MHGRAARRFAFFRAGGAALLTCFVAACGGGAGSTAAPPAAIQAVTAATAAPAQLAQASISIVVPAATTASSARSAAYVSPSSQSLSISSYAVVNGTIASAPSGTVNQDLSAISPGCTGSSQLTCTVTLAVPSGRVAFGVTVYSGLGETGSVLSILPQSAATEYTLTAGTNNTVLPLVLGGVVRSIVVVPAATQVTGGAAATIAVTVTARDAAGNIIIGSAPYASAIALTDSDTSGASAISPASVSAPTTAVSFTFTGLDFPSPLTLSAAASGASDTPATIALQPGALSVACSSGCSGIVNATTPYAETITEPGYGSGSFTLSGSGTACTFDPATTVTAAGGTATVHVYPDPAGGTCTLAVHDSYAQSGTASLAFTAAANPTIVTNCGYSFIFPPDPAGGTLYIYNGCGTKGVQYGSYLSVALDSTYNPEAFVIATYANPNEASVNSFTVEENRYITSATIAGSDVVFSGQSGNSNVPFSSFIP